MACIAPTTQLVMALPATALAYATVLFRLRSSFCCMTSLMSVSFFRPRAKVEVSSIGASSSRILPHAEERDATAPKEDSTDEECDDEY